MPGLFGPTFSTLLTCSGCVATMESLAGSNTSMHLLTFLTFLLIVAYGVTRSPQHLFAFSIPFSAYVQIVLLFFVISVINNQSVNFQIPFPLHIIFRSGTLIANVLLGRLLQGKTYSYSKYTSITLVTAGLAIFTLASQPKLSNQAHAHGGEQAVQHQSITSFSTGILLMTGSLFGSAYMGILQEQLFHVHGKHPEEMMLNVHLYSLPLFVVIFWRSMITDAIAYSRSPSIRMPQMIADLPYLHYLCTTQWLALFVTCMLQMLCIKSVYRMTAYLGSLQLTMVLTLRKSINLLLSVWIYGNVLSPAHLLAAVMVFLGTAEFYGLSTRLVSISSSLGWHEPASRRKHTKSP